jgi:hypothetical protein
VETKFRRLTTILLSCSLLSSLLLGGICPALAGGTLENSKINLVDEDDGQKSNKPKDNRGENSGFENGGSGKSGNNGGENSGFENGGSGKSGDSGGENSGSDNSGSGKSDSGESGKSGNSGNGSGKSGNNGGENSNPKSRADDLKSKGERLDELSKRIGEAGEELGERVGEFKDNEKINDRLSTDHRFSDDFKEVLRVKREIGAEKFDEIVKEQMSSPAYRTIAGGDSKSKFRDANIAAKEHGGNPLDYVKKSSKKIPINSKECIETHWIENTKTGERYEFKQKVVK